LDSQSSEELIARAIAQAFPAATLVIKHGSAQSEYHITLKEEVLVRLDQIGAELNFPTRGSGKITWRDIKEGGPEAVAELIVRLLADAGFTVFSKNGKRIQKRPVPIGRFTFCPDCHENGFMASELKWAGSA